MPKRPPTVTIQTGTGCQAEEIPGNYESEYQEKVQ
jgi:hypothetical protein